MGRLEPRGITNGKTYRGRCGDKGRLVRAMTRYPDFFKSIPLPVPFHPAAGAAYSGGGDSHYRCSDMYVPNGDRDTNTDVNMTPAVSGGSAGNAQRGKG